VKIECVLAEVRRVQRDGPSGGDPGRRERGAAQAAEKPHERPPSEAAVVRAQQ
jgi:hypothetical protein